MVSTPELSCPTDGFLADKENWADIPTPTSFSGRSRKKPTIVKAGRIAKRYAYTTHRRWKLLKEPTLIGHECRVTSGEDSI